MSFSETSWVWLNGQRTRWNEARIHSSAHALHYGTGVFEGIRTYLTDRGPAIFRLDTHLERLFASARVYGMEIPFTHVELADATRDLIARNGFGDSYLRHLCFFDSAGLGIRAECPVSVVILAWPWENHHGRAGLDSGIRASISPWRKFSSEMMPTTAKAAGQYLNSRLAITEALRRGFDEAILRDVKGNIAEASVANVFIVRDGRIITNDERSSILLGITRASVIELARDLGYGLDITAIRVDDLLNADEVFLTGTASEVVPVREIDDRVIGQGSRGTITTQVQQAFFAATSGRDGRHEDWLDFVVENENANVAALV